MFSICICSNNFSWCRIIDKNIDNPKYISPSFNTCHFLSGHLLNNQKLLVMFGKNWISII